MSKKQFFLVGRIKASLGAAHKNIWLNTNLTENSNRAQKAWLCSPAALGMEPE